MVHKLESTGFALKESQYHPSGVFISVNLNPYLTTASEQQIR